MNKDKISALLSDYGMILVLILLFAIFSLSTFKKVAAEGSGAVNDGGVAACTGAGAGEVAATGAGAIADAVPKPSAGKAPLVSPPNDVAVAAGPPKLAAKGSAGG